MNKEDYFKYYIQGSEHYLIPKDVFNELFDEMESWKQDTNKYKEVIDKAIDLIEVGDYVNGYKVLEVDYDAEEEKYIRIDKAQDGLKTILKNNDIKSIVTKEIFSSMEYRLGDE